jgi:PAS domain S-box-containing protein
MQPDGDLLFEYTSDAVVVLDEALAIVAANGRAALLYRRHVSELLGRPLLHVFPELAGSPTEAQLRHALSARIPVRFEMFIPSLFGWHSVLAVQRGTVLTLFCRDITDRVRKEQEDAVRASVRNIVENLPVCVTITRGTKHRIELTNAEARQLLNGRSVEGELLENVLPETRAQGFIDLLDEVLRTGRPFRGEEVRVQWQPSAQEAVREGFFDLVYQPLLGPAGDVTGILHLGTEVTDKVQRRQTLARVAAEREAVLAQMTEGVIVTDAQGRITLVNEAAQRMHGTAELDVPPEGYTARYNLLTDDGAPHPVDELPLSRAVRRRETVLGAVWKIQRPDGSILRVVGHAKPVLDADGQLLAAVLTLGPAPD